MAENFNTYPIDLKSVILYDFKGNAITLTYDLIEIVIEESIDTPVLKGYARILDALNLIEYLPIVGEEKLELSYTIPGETKVYTKVFHVYGYTSPERQNDRTLKYDLLFVSSEFKYNGVNRIQKSYTKRSDQIIFDILANYLQIAEATPPKTFTTDPSCDVLDVIIPNLRPFQAIEFVRSRSYSSKYLTSNYMFFETWDGYVFKTIDQLIEETKNEPREFKFIQQNIEQTTDATENPSYDSVINFSLTRPMDTISSNEQGMFRNSLLTVDWIRKKYETFETDYMTEFGKYQTVDHVGFPINQSAFLEELNAPAKSLAAQGTIHFLPSNHGRNEIAYNRSGGRPKEFFFDTHYRDYYLPRNNSLMMLRSSKINAALSGSNLIVAGDVIKVTFPSFTGIEPRFTQDAKYVSGNYLVAKIKRVITLENYVMEAELFKNDYSNELQYTHEQENA